MDVVRVSTSGLGKKISRFKYNLSCSSIVVVELICLMGQLE